MTEPPIVETPPAEPQEPAVQANLSQPQRDAMELVEALAARCWLDGELQGDALVVDRLQNRLIVVSGDDRILKANLSPLADGRTQVTLTGAAIADSATATRLVTHLRRAEDTGETAC